MGLFARLTCLRHDGHRDGLRSDGPRLAAVAERSRNTGPAVAERLLMIAPAGDSWLMVFDHVEDPSAAISDADGLLAELGRTSGALALDLLVFLLTKASEQGGIIGFVLPNSCKKDTSRRSVAGAG